MFVYATISNGFKYDQKTEQWYAMVMSIKIENDKRLDMKGEQELMYMILNKTKSCLEASYDPRLDNVSVDVDQAMIEVNRFESIVVYQFDIYIPLKYIQLVSDYDTFDKALSLTADCLIEEARLFDAINL